MPLSTELVHLVGREEHLNLRVRKAIDWITSKPEGLKILEEAKILYGTSLPILVDPSVHAIGYGDHLGNHLILANPIINDNMFLQDVNGGTLQNSLERFLCHELKHATQFDVLTHAQKYTVRYSIFIGESFPNIPFNKYLRRIEAIKNKDDALRELFGEIYDAHVADKAKQIMEEVLHKLSTDTIAQDFIQKYEVPAIQFENEMMQKYKGEVRRSEDYVNSGVYDQLLKATDRGAFIESSLTSYRAQVPKENNPEKIR